jgi:hypothetical protein
LVTNDLHIARLGDLKRKRKFVATEQSRKFAYFMEEENEATMRSQNIPFADNTFTKVDYNLKEYIQKNYW